MSLFFLRLLCNIIYLQDAFVCYASCYLLLKQNFQQLIHQFVRQLIDGRISILLLRHEDVKCLSYDAF